MNHKATRVAYFGPDARDAAIKRRIQSMLHVGFRVRAYMMRRQEDMEHGWDNVDLGFVRHVAFVRRLGAIARAVVISLRDRAELRQADVWIARNLDLLVVAFLVRKFLSVRAPLVYECLDIHRLMTRTDWVGRVVRHAERRMLKDCADVIVSSPGFVREYFASYYGEGLHATIIENRMPTGGIADPRPSELDFQAGNRPWVLGWYGVLRCQRSLDLMCALARGLPDRIRVRLHGFTKPEDLPRFEEQISGLNNLVFKGRYRYPDDLPAIYGGVDLVWAGDFHDALFNSRWLLPNRLYEGGYFGVVPIAPKNSETGRWIYEKDVGFVVDEPIEQTLPKLLSELTAQAIAKKRKNLLATPIDVFIQPREEIEDYINGLLGARQPL